MDELTEKTIFTQMRVRRKPNNTARFVSCIFMMLALAWLTVSLPIVYSAQKTAEQKKAAANGSQEEENGNPFANTTEEKTPRSSNSLSEEYIHDVNTTEHHFTIVSLEYGTQHFPTYIAFYGDLESPPPDVA